MPCKKYLNSENSMKLLLSTFFTFLIFYSAHSANAQASTNMKASAQHGSAASENSAASSVHGLAASGQLTSAAAALPLSAAGVVLTGAGEVSGNLGKSLSEVANSPIGTPLPVSDENFSITPPNEALKNNNP